MKKAKKKVKNRYPAELKIAFALGIEKELFENELLKSIPYSTRNFWRSKDPKQLIQNEKSDTVLDKVDQFLSDQKLALARADQLKKVYQEYNEFIITCMGQHGYLKFLENHKREFVNWLNEQKKRLNKSELLSILSISEARFQTWQAQVLFKCSDSPLARCAKISSQQLTKSEANRIRHLVQNRRFNLYATWAVAFRKGKLKISKSTFYKYVKVLGLTPEKTKLRKFRSGSIVSTRVHEIWHADITEIPTLDGKKSYLYAIMDNYSRAIIAFRIERVVRGYFSEATLRAAYQAVMQRKITYITDGGTENTSKPVKDYLSSKQIQHLIARKDIRQSNSMIERIFKTLKGEFTAILEARNHPELQMVAAELIKMYNSRPHGHHFIYTPNEVLFHQANWLNVADQLKSGSEERLTTNQTCNCNKCDCKDLPIAMAG